LIWYNTDKVDRTWRDYANSLEEEFKNDAARQVLEERLNNRVWIEDDERKNRENS
jgi:hypothetical protein